jgi:hypothetical protein
MSSDPSFMQQRLAEAARYALMRRLLPSIRHDIAGTLQPISMLAAVIHRQAQSGALDPVQLGKNSQALTSLTGEAAASCLNLMNWLAPKDNDLVAADGAIEESLALMTTELSFRGFSIANETAGLDLRLPRAIFRSVFTASLIALTDSFEGVASIVISAGATDAGTQLNITLEPGGSLELGLSARTPVYRSLGWDDVQLLAQAEAVALSHGANWVQLLYCTPANTAMSAG